MDKLKPCPFCGGEAYIQSLPTARKTKIYSVKCRCGVMFRFMDRKYKAIEAWNRRATDVSKFSEDLSDGALD